jgi:protein gp37
MIFVNSMSDLFHEGIPDAYLEQVFEVMGQARSGGLQWPRRGGLKWLHFASVGVCG